MKLEKSLTFNPPLAFWRVTLGMKPKWFPNKLWPVWGPFYPSPSQAIYYWIKDGLFVQYFGRPQLILWRVSTLLLSWALLGAALALINHNTTHLEPAEFGSICIASAAYLLSTYNLLKPLCKTK